MSYFSDHYPTVRLAIPEGEQKGLRTAQLGAIHAIASHFTLHDDPGLVVMPTGSGKTAVLMLSAFFMRAKRVLVITPSKLVRDQIAEEFATLQTLKEANALDSALNGPAVGRVTKKRTTAQLWDELREFDVAVSTPLSVSPGLNDVPEPPDDLFDLVLCDEAHHSPAKTWAHLLKAFPKAKKVLFTATPFRRDRREIAGRFVYAYPIRRAYDDGIFGDITFVPVELDGDSADTAVAKAAERVYEEDKAAGFDHRLMVRTDSKKRAEELAAIYGDNTNLKLEVVHSGYSYRTIKRTVKALSEGTIDGIICVSMLGEGFDLPQLKIAAVHVPHRSLEVTLQFIGRFARTNAVNIGTAKFIALPNDIKHETERLYRQGSTWTEIVANLSEGRVSREAEVREAIEKFDEPKVEEAEIKDVSLYGLRPYSHVKIYEVEEDIDVTTDIAFPGRFEVVYRAPSPELSASVIITRETEQPRWTDVSLFQRSEYDLFVIYYHRAAKLLFINSSRRILSLYEHIATTFTRGKHRILPLYKISRVLRALRGIECFNIGMRNRVANSSVESYRIIAGSQAQRALGPRDGQLYHRGHVYVRADEGGSTITLGYSSGSKVWANQNLQIPVLLTWCKTLGDKISDESQFQTGSQLDQLSAGEKVAEFPEGPIAVDWHPDAYKHSFRIKYTDTAGTEQVCDALDCDFTVQPHASDKRKLTITVSVPGQAYVVNYGLGQLPYFSSGKPKQVALMVVRREEEIDILSYLNNYPFAIYFCDFSRVSGEEIFTAPKEYEPFKKASIVGVSWDAENVDIELEFDSGTPGKKRSIHAYLKDKLAREDLDVVLYDHGTGEIADLVTLKKEKKRITVSFYHCKGAGDSAPGDRVGDVYEVCGQVVKSMLWLERMELLLARVRRRIERGSVFLRGDMKALEDIVEAARHTPLFYKICLVQPGISAAKITEKNLHVLAAANEYVRGGAIAEMEVIASA